MKVSDAIRAMHHRAAGCAGPLEPLVMGVSAALGCVAAEDIYLAPLPKTRADSDATTVLDPIRPVVAAGSVIGPWQQQALMAAGVANLRVIPQPRVVVMAIDDASAPVHTTALLSTLTLSGALAMPVQVSIDDDIADAVDDQLVRADLIVLCAAPTAKGVARDVCARIGGHVMPLWSGVGVPDVESVWLGGEQVPTLLIGDTVDEHLAAYSLALQPMLATMLGQNPAGGTRVESSASESRLRSVVHASGAGDLGDSVTAELGRPSDDVFVDQAPGSSGASVINNALALPGISVRLSTGDGADVDATKAAAAVRVTDDMGGQHLIPLPKPTSADLLSHGIGV